MNEDRIPLYEVGQIVKFKGNRPYKIITGRNWNIEKKCYVYLVADLPSKAVAYDEEWLDMLVDHSVTSCYQDSNGRMLAAGDQLKKNKLGD